MAQEEVIRFLWSEIRILLSTVL